MFAGGRRLATGGTAGTVTIWDVPSRTVVRRLRFLEPVWATAVSPDGTLIAVAAPGRGRCRCARGGARPRLRRDALHAHDRFGPGGLAFSADGSTLIASGCCEDGATVTAWDARSGAQRFQRDVPQVAHAFAVSPAGRTLAVGTGDGRVLVLDARTGALRSQMKVSAGDIQQIVFSPDGRLIAASSAGTADNAVGRPLGQAHRRSVPTHPWLDGRDDVRTRRPSAAVRAGRSWSSGRRTRRP